MTPEITAPKTSIQALEEVSDQLCELKRDQAETRVEASMGERIATVAAVVLPVIGLFGAMYMLWGGAFRIIDLVMFFALYLISGLGITIGYHRLFTHRSFEAPGWVRYMWGAFGSMAAEGSVVDWVGMHRCHHQHSDDKNDPHSPHQHGSGVIGMIKGFWHAHTGWMFRPDPVNLARYIVDFKDDKVVQAVSRHFGWWLLVGLVVPTVIGGLWDMSWKGALLGFLWGGAVRTLWVHHVTWSINSVCHIWGGRPYKSHDESRNNPIMGILGFGEGWHNNHHAFPASARHGLAWWQFDTSYILIRAMEKVGMASRVRVPDAERMKMKLR